MQGYLTGILCHGRRNMSRLPPRTTCRLWFSLTTGLLLVCCFLSAGCSPRGVTTTTFTGSSAHWKAKYVVRLEIVNKDYQTVSRTKLDIWWTGALSASIDKPQYQLTGLHGFMQGGDMPGSLDPWVSRGEGGNAATAKADDKLFLTITWNGDSSEEMALVSH
jgi:hypothetical protein